jgi:hypothetical protein
MAIYFHKKSLYWGPTASGKVIGDALGVGRKQLLSRSSTPPPLWSTIINWGVGMEFHELSNDWVDQRWWNHPQCIAISANKISMMARFKARDVPCLQVVNKDEVDPETVLVARHLLSSHSGNGIEIAAAKDIGDAPLYTVLQEFEVEQRLFIVADKIVDRAQKKKMGKAKLAAIGRTSVDPHIKSHKNGWVFAKNDIHPGSPVVDWAALKAMAAIGLDFGCVDVAFNDPDNPIVIETNSTPGFKNQETIRLFSEALREIL